MIVNEHADLEKAKESIYIQQKGLLMTTFAANQSSQNAQKVEEILECATEKRLQVCACIGNCVFRL